MNCLFLALASVASVLHGEGGTKDKVTFNGIRVFPSQQKVEVDTTMAVTDGIVEFLLVQNGGKDYESLLQTAAKASHLNVALGLIGLKEQKIELAKDGQIKSIPPSALTDGALTIRLKWTLNEKLHSASVEELLIRRAIKKTPPEASWIYTGSEIRDIEGVGKVFTGDYEKTLGGIWFARSGVFNYSVKSRNPYWGEDAGFQVNSKAVPPTGTKILMILTRWVKAGGNK